MLKVFVTVPSSLPYLLPFREPDRAATRTRDWWLDSNEAWTSEDLINDVLKYVGSDRSASEFKTQVNGADVNQQASIYSLVSLDDTITIVEI